MAYGMRSAWRCLLCGMLSAALVFVFGRGEGQCGGDAYYSIHLASFKNLKNANAYVNTLKEKGKLVFWKEADVPGKGRFYRVYLGKYRDRDDAVEFWRRLDAQKAVSYFGVHRFTEPEEAAMLAKPRPPAAKRPPPSRATVPPGARFVDNGDGTVTDRMTNLMWVKNGWRIDFVSAVPWNEANRKCIAFKHGGHDNWRLPTIEEWETLIDETKERPAIVEPNPFENVITHMPYWSRSSYAFGPDQAGGGTKAPHAYVVMLYFGKVGHQNKNKRAFILPVRSVE